MIWSNFQGPKLRFGQSVYPRGVGGRGVPIFARYPEHSREVRAEKNGSIPGLKSHFLQKEAATRTGIAAFLFLRLIPVYALEGYWTARVRGDFESLVTCEFRFGNEDSGSASQHVSGRAAGKGLCFRTLPHRTRKDAALTPKSSSGPEGRGLSRLCFAGLKPRAPSESRKPGNMWFLA